MFSRKKVAMLVAEALGTAVLTFSVLAITKSAIGIPYFVALGTGLTLALIVTMFGSASGALVNPAVTFGLWTVRKLSTLDAVSYIAAQFVGAISAMRLYQYVLARPVLSIAADKMDWRVFVAEMVGTAVFTFGIASAVYQKSAGGKLALTIGGSLAVGVLVAGVASNGLLNPAVALGVQSWDKTYVLAPLAGSFVGMNLYSLLFAGERPAVSVAVESFQKPAPKKAAKRKAKK
jgi:glycerol uptake facilitator-like aquaporin